jgi:hypothetical protein
LSEGAVGWSAPPASEAILSSIISSSFVLMGTCILGSGTGSAATVGGTNAVEF